MQRVGSLLTRVGAVPPGREEVLGRVGGVGERAVVVRHLAPFHLRDLLTYCQHRIHETVELVERLTLCGLDHERAGHREAHGGGVEAVVDESLGHVVDRDTSGSRDGPQVEDALVGHAVVVARVEHGEGGIQAGGDVVGVEDRQLGCTTEAVGSHQRDVGPGDGQDRSRAIGRSRDGAGTGGGTGVWVERVVWQERGQVGAHRNRAHAGAASAVRDAERLVQVQVADVAAEPPRPSDADEGVQIGAVDVHLSAVTVHEIAQVGDVLLEHPVG